jgi:hypothetical protein
MSPPRVLFVAFSFPFSLNEYNNPSFATMFQHALLNTCITTCRWVDNIRMDLGEVGWSNVDWIGLAQDRNRWRALVNSVLNLRVP